MIVLGGIGSIAGSRSFRVTDLVLPGNVRDLAEQWIFGRSNREDLLAASDAAAGEGIRHSAAERQAALEVLFGALVVGQYHAALDDAQSTLTEDPTIEDVECQALNLALRETIETLRLPVATVEEEMRAYVRASVEQILAGPVGQWRTRLADKFAEVAEAAHEGPLADLLDRDFPTEHATCQALLTFSRLRVAGERF